MLTIEPQAIRDAIDDVDYWSIYDPAEFIGKGIPAELVLPHVETYVDDPANVFTRHWSKGKRSIHDPETGALLNRVTGISCLDLLDALAAAVGADTAEADRKYGRGFRGAELKRAILAAIN